MRCNAQEEQPMYEISVPVMVTAPTFDRDAVLQDLKLADPVAHRQYTGVDNEKILRNIRWLQQSGKDYVLRIPLIPGITDTAENLSALAAIAESSPVELMPYNPLAGAKYPMVDMTYSLPELQPSGEDLTRYFQNAVLLG